MSLFPAYASAVEEKVRADQTLQEENSNWCNLTSFRIDPAPSSDLHLLNTNSTSSKRSVDDDSAAPSASKSTKHKKKKHKSKRERSVSPVIVKDESFRIDTTRNTEFLTVDRITRPAAPKYKISAYLTTSRQGRWKRKFKRYFKVKNLLTKADEESVVEEAVLTKSDLEKPVTKQISDSTESVSEEERLSQKTAFFNRTLSSAPNNIVVWLEYVDFQDVVFQFEKSFKKGSLAKALRVTAERKVSILEKALYHNPNSESLHRKRLNVLVDVFPSDELQVELKKLVQKDEGNIILWQGYIESTQCSMSHCTTPAVLEMYIKCLHKLHTIRRSAGSPTQRSQLEENILRMLYQAGLFLKQAGLFEQLWTLLELYLQLNLATPEVTSPTFTTGIVLPADRQLCDLEEVVLQSQLPLHELWLRVEKLREACHWMPVSDTSLCEDPQRLVFRDDVSDLIHPITLPGNCFKLTVTVLTLLKLPLLPHHRHTTLHALGLDYVPWALDSVETVLSACVSDWPVGELGACDRLKGLAQRLTVGPQYLRTLPGQEEYLNFLLAVISGCQKSLTGNEHLAITVWRFRFLSLLITIESAGLCKLSATVKKQLRADVKNLLKNDRNNLVLYREFALFENACGNKTSAINVLKTAIEMSSANNKSLIIDIEGGSDKVAVIRTLIELEFDNDKANCVKCLVRMVLGDLTKEISSATILEALTVFSGITNKLVSSQQELPIVTHFLPDFFTDFTICQGYLIYLTQSITDFNAFLSEIFTQLPTTLLQTEILKEFQLALLFRRGRESKLWSNLGFDGLLESTCREYPNNVFMLSVLAQARKMRVCGTAQWWRCRQFLLNAEQALPGLFAVLIEQEEMTRVLEIQTESAPELEIKLDYSLKNRMLYLFKQLTNSNICTKRCGLIWRLYLQFLHAYGDPKSCRNAYYSAVDECPWLKALYIDAAIYIPEELPQIQDLIIEKQLRIHVTPEELDVLRD